MRMFRSIWERILSRPVMGQAMGARQGMLRGVRGAEEKGKLLWEHEPLGSMLFCEYGVRRAMSVLCERPPQSPRSEENRKTYHGGSFRVEFSFALLCTLDTNDSRFNWNRGSCFT
jgi:hypothetical protein